MVAQFSWLVAAGMGMLLEQPGKMQIVPFATGGTRETDGSDSSADHRRRGLDRVVLVGVAHRTPVLESFGGKGLAPHWPGAARTIGPTNLWWPSLRRGPIPTTHDPSYG